MESRHDGRGAVCPLILLRLYGPLEPFFNKTWRLGEIERVK